MFLGYMTDPDRLARIAKVKNSEKILEIFTFNS